ncbi:MAG TPA: lipopolysaccharide transport periplasmic protein LptA [Burkholderiales bacterium]|jgi:lipopolysaccharide export system protein LptA
MRRAIPIVAMALLVAFAARAEKADRDKPTQIEANRMSADDVKRMTIFDGSVVLTKGTIVVRADRIVVRQDAEGFQLVSATGAPVRFKQKQDPKEGEKEGRWMDGEALRVEIDERKQTVELFDNARVNRGGDEVAGAYIFVDQRSDFFQVTTGKGKEGQPSGRVTAVIQPNKGSGDAKDAKK